MVKKIHLITLISSLLIILNCSTTSNEDNVNWDQLGLKATNLQMSEGDFEDIYKNELVDEWMPAIVNNTYLSIRRHGNSSREEPKPSFKALFNDSMTIYSAQYTDKSFCRYRLTDYLFKKAGFETSDLNPILFFINNNFLGIYLEREGVNQRFFDRRGMKVNSVYKVNSGGELTFEHGMNLYSAFKKKIPNNDLCFSDLEKLVTIIDKGLEDSNRKELEKILDVYNALDYYAVCTIASSYDCIKFNYYLIFNIEINKFEFLPWDLDRTFKGAEDELPEYENGLFEMLLEYESYEEYFIKKRKELFNKEELFTELDNYASEIENAYTYDPLLNNINILNNEIEYIRDYINRVDKYINDIEEDD